MFQRCEEMLYYDIIIIEKSFSGSCKNIIICEPALLRSSFYISVPCKNHPGVLLFYLFLSCESHFCISLLKQNRHGFSISSYVIENTFYL